MQKKLKKKYFLIYLIKIIVGVYLFLVLVTMIYLRVLGFGDKPYFMSFDTPVEREVKTKFLNYYPKFILPFFVSYKIKTIVNETNIYNLYLESPNEYGKEFIETYKKRLDENGYCTFNGTYGSWKVIIEAHSIILFPISFQLTCNNGLMN